MSAAKETAALVQALKGAPKPPPKPTDEQARLLMARVLRGK